MPGTDGYLGTPPWDITMLRGGIRINGAALVETSMWPINWTPQGTPGTRHRMMDGGDIVQHQWIGGDCPLNLGRPLSIPVTFQHNSEADWKTLCRVELTGPVRIFLGLWVVDLWYIPGKNTGQTLWKCSRQFPYALSGVTHASHPPQAYIDGAAQTIITTGTPSAGQVKVPQAGGYQAITTPSAITGEFLELWYPAELLVTIEGPNTGNPQANLLTYAATLQEVQGSGGYTGAMA